MSTPIPTIIREKLAELIRSMTIATGYYYDWTRSAINQRNYAIGEWPRAEIYCREEINHDEMSGHSSQDYTNVMTVEIRLAAKLPTVGNIPLFEIDDQFDKMQEDLKRLFGLYNQNSVDGVCDSVLYSESRRTESSGSGDQFIPAKISTFWKIRYSQDRLTPSLYASS